MTNPSDPFQAASSPSRPTPADRRTAVAALDAARPLVARMDAGAPAAHLAADLVDAWAAVETSLRALLGGSALGGQPLVTEARQRGLLEYPHAHALLAFDAARLRAAVPGHAPTTEDVIGARSGFQALEAALGLGIAANTGTFDAVRPDRLAADAASYGSGHGSGNAAPAFGRPVAGANRPSPGAFDSGSFAPGDGRAPDAPPRRRGPSPALVVGLLALLALLGAGAWWAFGRPAGDPAAYAAGVAAYRSGQRDVARTRFAEAVRDEPTHAASHVFLGRLAREDGDLARATSEITRAIELDTTSVLAYREMGQLQLQANRPDLAARFLKRALERDQTDRVALGWMGCAMARQGQAELADRFFRSAGPGDWTACRATAAPGGPLQGPPQGIGGAPPGAPPPLPNVGP